MTTMTLVLNDDACLKTIGDISDRLRTAVAEHDNISLDLDGVTHIDLSIVQLIESARRHVADTGGSLTLARPAPAPLAALLDRAGFLNSASPADMTFWFHGDSPQ